jgi:hypothetical protein
VQTVSNPALAPSAMEGGNMVATNMVAMALGGSEPITPMPEAPNLLDPNLPMPKIPAERIPLSTQAGKYGGVGLPPSPDPQDEPLRPPGAEPGRDRGGFTTGPQPGGNQGRGGPGAGTSGPDLWKPTLSFGPPSGNPSATGF